MPLSFIRSAIPWYNCSNLVLVLRPMLLALSFEAGILISLSVGYDKIPSLALIRRIHSYYHTIHTDSIFPATRRRKTTFLESLLSVVSSSVLYLLQSNSNLPALSVWHWLRTSSTLYNCVQQSLPFFIGLTHRFSTKQKASIQPCLSRALCSTNQFEQALGQELSKSHSTL